MVTVAVTLSGPPLSRAQQPQGMSKMLSADEMTVVVALQPAEFDLARGRQFFE
jgi:hypothetical protein